MRDEHSAHRLLSVGRVPSPPTLPEVRKAIGGGRYLINLSCWDQYLAMAFAQLTYRESNGPALFASRLHHVCPNSAVPSQLK
jgi:hypothetical protein